MLCVRAEHIAERALSQFLFLARTTGYVKLIISGRCGGEVRFQCSPLPLRFSRDFRFAPTGFRCQEGETQKPILTRTAKCQTRNFEYRSNHFIILRFLVLLFDIQYSKGRRGHTYILYSLSSTNPNFRAFSKVFRARRIEPPSTIFPSNATAPSPVAPAFL